MGKTGTVEWQKIRGRKGQIRLVARAESTYKKPGPLQKYRSKGARCRKIRRSSKAVVTR